MTWEVFPTVETFVILLCFAFVRRTLELILAISIILALSLIYQLTLISPYRHRDPYYSCISVCVCRFDAYLYETVKQLKRKGDSSTKEAVFGKVIKFVNFSPILRQFPWFLSTKPPHIQPLCKLLSIIWFCVSGDDFAKSKMGLASFLY